MQILCPQCGRTTEVDDNFADQTVVCAHCNGKINIDSAVSESPKPSEGFASQAMRAMKGKLVVACRLCGARLEVPKRAVGKETRCPACGKEIMISPPHADDTIPPPIRRHTTVDITKPTAAENISRQVPLWVFLLLSATAGAVAGGIVWILIVE